MRPSEELHEAARQTKIFGKAMGLVVRKSSYPEALEQHLSLKPPFEVYTVHTPKPHDTSLGYVLKKGKQWYYTDYPHYRLSKGRGPMPTLKSLVMRHIIGIMRTEQKMSDGTLESALEGLGCPILQRLAHEWGIAKEFGNL